VAKATLKVAKLPIKVASGNSLIIFSRKTFGSSEAKWGLADHKVEQTEFSLTHCF